MGRIICDSVLSRRRISINAGESNKQVNTVLCALTRIRLTSGSVPTKIVTCCQLASGLSESFRVIVVQCCHPVLYYIASLHLVCKFQSRLLAYYRFRVTQLLMCRHLTVNITGYYVVFVQ